MSANGDGGTNGRSRNGARAAADANGRAKWWRRRGGKSSGFYYVDADGERIRDEESVERANGLAVPPAWSHVRISPHPTGKVQAVGVDDAGRLQYIYNSVHEARRSREKYAKVERFGLHLPALRRRTNEDVGLQGLPRPRVLALAVRLMNDLYFRVGSEKSAKHHRTFGVTTLRNRHIEIKGDRLEFSFKGKSGVAQRGILVDEKLADAMRELKALGGARLFEYEDDDGVLRPVTPRDVNAYVKEATMDEFSAKDFRTWGGTLLTAVELAELGPPEGEQDAKRKVTAAVKAVAEHLGNTPAVCRSAYVHPTVLKCFENGVTLEDLRPRGKRRVHYRQPEYEPEERALMALFEKYGNGFGEKEIRAAGRVEA